MRILVIPNSILSIFAIIEYLNLLDKSLKIEIDVIFVETTRPNIREPLVQYLRDNKNFELNILYDEINHFELTSIKQAKEYRTKFVKENLFKINKSHYDEILLANVYLLGLVRKLKLDRSKIKLVHHGISDILEPLNKYKQFLIRIYGEIEQIVLGYGINPIFALHQVTLNNKASVSLGDFWNIYTDKSDLNFTKSAKVIINLPHIFDISKKKYVDLIISQLNRLRISNSKILCKSHPSLDVSNITFINDIISTELTKSDLNSNTFLKLDSKEPIEMYLNSGIELILGEISTSMLTAKFLHPGIKIVVTNFNHLFKHSLNMLKSDGKLHGNELMDLSKVFYEYEDLYKRLNLSDRVKMRIDQAEY